MPEQDFELLEKISKELNLTREEIELFAKIIAGICDTESQGWEDALRRLEQQVIVKSAILEYFKRNPLTKDDVVLH